MNAPYNNNNGCNCIECVGDLPEPIAVQESNGAWVIMYRRAKLTKEHETEEAAWVAFDQEYN